MLENSMVLEEYRLLSLKPLNPGRRYVQRRTGIKRSKPSEPVDWSAAVDAAMAALDQSPSSNDSELPDFSPPDHDPIPIDSAPSKSQSERTLSDYYIALDALWADGQQIFFSRHRYIALPAELPSRNSVRHSPLSRSSYCLINCKDAFAQHRSTNPLLYCDCEPSALTNCHHVAFVRKKFLSNGLDFFRCLFPLGELPGCSLDCPSVEILKEYGSSTRLRRIFFVLDAPFKIPRLVAQDNCLNLREGVRCRGCKGSAGKRCIHRKLAVAFAEKENLEVCEWRSSRHERSFHDCQSWREIPVPRYLDPSAGGAPPDFIPLDQVLQDSDPVCRECFEHSRQSGSFSMLGHSDAMLFTQMEAVPVKVARLSCNTCSSLVPFDGCSRRVFNYNGKLLISHSLLNLYSILFSSLSCPFNAFTLCLNRKYCDLDSPKFINYQTFVIAWCSFVQLQRWELAYRCESCGDNPQTIYCDATSVNIRRKYAGNLCSPARRPEQGIPLPVAESTKIPLEEAACFTKPVRERLTAFLVQWDKLWKRPESVESRVKRYGRGRSWKGTIKRQAQKRGRRKSSRSQMKLPISDSSSSSCSLRSSSSSRSSSRSSSPAAGELPESSPAAGELPESSLRLLPNALLMYDKPDISAEPNVDVLRRFINWLSNDGVLTLDAVVVEQCRTLLSVLACTESIVALLKPSTAHGLARFIKNYRDSDPIWDSEADSFNDAMPLLYSFLASFGFWNFVKGIKIKVPIPSIVLDLLDCVAQRAIEVHYRYDSLARSASRPPELYNWPSKQASPDSRGAPPISQPAVLSDYERLKSQEKGFHGQFYGHRPVLRDRIPIYDIDDLKGRDKVKSVDGLSCTKRYTDEGVTSGGVLALWCAHGISYGFHMLESAESLRDVMSAIMRTWDRAPPCIVYDNACHLMFYCHSREWNYWKETTFYIDSFHDFNHIACSLAHSIKSSKCSDAVKFLYMNTSVSESGNAGLSKLKISMRNMAADSAFICVLIQLELQNSIRRLEQSGKLQWKETMPLALQHVAPMDNHNINEDVDDPDADEDEFDCNWRLC